MLVACVCVIRRHQKGDKVIIQKVKSSGLSHLSYFLVSGSCAAVIDPRRDVEVYLNLARQHGARVTHIFETHRNEDLISGAPILAKRTKARVFHGPNPDAAIEYAETTHERDTYEIGQARIEVLETPGHTNDSLSFVLYDQEFDSSPVGVFTGDALFIGDVGRTDFYPDRAREVAGLLFDSLQKLLELGDGVIVYPAHGAGSVCGSGMADREFSTVGHERQNNPRLAFSDREKFIDYKVAEHHYQPPYFRLMERLNASGGSAIDVSLAPPVLPAGSIDNSEATLVDVRSIHAYSGAHIPGSVCIPVDMLPAFAGWLLDPKDALILIAADVDEAHSARCHLARIGFDDVRGYVPGPMSVATSGGQVDSLPVVGDDVVADRLADNAQDWQLLDVRGIDEFESMRIEGARHIYLGELPGSIDQLDRETAYTVLCGTGARATIGASKLKAEGFRKVDVFLGSMEAWLSQDRPVRKDG
jgi:hydroxyacylglutathione hydrolase